MSHDAKGSQGVEMKFTQRTTLEVRANVFRQDLRLAKSELGGGWTWFLSFCIDHRRAIAECPKSRLAWNGEGAINDQCSPFVLLQRESLHQRIWHSARCPHQSLCLNLAIVQNHHVRTGVRQTRVQTEDDAPRLHSFLRVTR